MNVKSIRCSGSFAKFDSAIKGYSSSFAEDQRRVGNKFLSFSVRIFQPFSNDSHSVQLYKYGTADYQYLQKLRKNYTQPRDRLSYDFYVIQETRVDIYKGSIPVSV